MTVLFKAIQHMAIVSMAASLATAASTVLPPDAGDAKLDMKSTECKDFTAAKVNKQQAECTELTAACLKGFDTTELSQECLKALKTDTLKGMDPKTAKELILAPLTKLPKKMEFLMALIDKNDWKTNPARDFIMAMATDTEQLKNVMEWYSTKPDVAARFYTKDTIIKMTAGQCALIKTKELVAAMKPDAFSDVSKECLAAVSPAAFEGFTGDSFREIKAVSLSGITRDQAEKLTKSAISEMTLRQASNWGTSDPPPKITGNTPDEIAKSKAEFEKFVAEHPCSAVKKWASSVGVFTKQALRHQCKKVWDGSDAGAHSATYSHSVLFGAAAVVILGFA